MWNMNNPDMDTQYPLTATAKFDLVTTRTLIKVLALLGIEWSPIPFDQMMPTSEKGLYTWAIGAGYERVDPFDRPVAYVGIGTSKDGGLRGRLLVERNLINDSAGHAHGRAMFRLQGDPLGGPVQRIIGADISPIEKTIRASGWKNKERGIQKLRAWLSAPEPDVVDKAEELCIRAAVHIGDIPPPLNGHHAGAWGSDAPCDWGGWAVAQLLGTGGLAHSTGATSSTAKG
jgi:hypothetical protein